LGFCIDFDKVKIMKEFMHNTDCDPADLPNEARRALKNGTLEGRVVSIVPPCRVMNPHEIDLEDSGIFYPLSQFLNPTPELIASLPPKIAIYKCIGENPDKLHSLRIYSW
jgi:hypothetical protein